jgi:hypothetical protein
MKNEIIAPKIDITMLMDLLQELYHFGVDFVDISLETSEDKIKVTFTYQDEYLDPEIRQKYEDEDKPKEEPTKLTKDDINNLL